MPAIAPMPRRSVIDDEGERSSEETAHQGFETIKKILPRAR
jgi:hypothetical protein